MLMSITICWKGSFPPGHRASMLQDLLLGRQTEIDALNGAITQYARIMVSAHPMTFSLH